MNAIAERTGGELAIAEGPDALIAMAIKHGANVDALERLMVMRRELMAEQARRDFFDALARFQSGCPPIPKTKVVMNKDGKTERYRYAPLDTIITTIREPLRAHGFSYRWQTEHPAENLLRVTCFLTHAGGHEESAEVIIPAVTGFGTNAAQDEGSAISYGKRYSFANVTGITVDEDNDAQTTGPDNAHRLIRMMDTAREWWHSISVIKESLAEGGDWTAAAEAYAEMPRPVIADLHVAPTKGGVWTTKEKDTLNRDAEFTAEVHRRRTDAGWYANPENAING